MPHTSIKLINVEILMWMCIITVIYQQDPITGTASVDKGEVLGVLEATRDLCLKTFYCLATISCFKLFQLISCDFFVGSTLQVQYDVSCFL